MFKWFWTVFSLGFPGVYAKTVQPLRLSIPKKIPLKGVWLRNKPVMLIDEYPTTLSIICTWLSNHHIEQKPGSVTIVSFVFV